MVRSPQAPFCAVTFVRNSLCPASKSVTLSLPEVTKLPRRLTFTSSVTVPIIAPEMTATSLVPSIFTEIVLRVPSAASPV